MHMKIVIGGIIPREDYDFLTSNGAAVIFGPGTRTLKALNPKSRSSSDQVHLGGVFRVDQIDRV